MCVICIPNNLFDPQSYLDGGQRDPEIHHFSLLELTLKLLYMKERC